MDPPPHAHRVFFQRPQPRRGLARADDARLGVRDARRECGGRGGDAGEVAEIIERGALGGKDGARIAADRHQLGAGLDRCAVARMRRDLDIGRQSAECRGDQRQPGDHAFLARGNDGAAAGVLRHRCDRGDIAGAAKVFLQRARHRRFDFQRRQESVGAQKRHGQRYDMRLRYGQHCPGKSLVRSQEDGKSGGWRASV